MTIIQYLLTFCLAVARPELGLIILMFAGASVGTAWSPTSLPGLGSLQLADFALLGLTVNLLFNLRARRNQTYDVWFLIVCWILGIALIHGISGSGGLKIAYALVMRYGLLWLIPIMVAELTPAKRRTLLIGMLACGAFVTGIQAYTYVKRDPSFAVKMYYQFQDPPSYGRPETDARHEFRYNAFPRLYPRGALLVQSLMVFVLVNYMLSHRPKWPNWPNWLMATLFCLYGLFFLSLRQRSSAIALAAALWLFLECRPAGSRRLRTVVRAISLGVVGICAVLAYQAATGASFVDDFRNRFHNENIFEQHNRVQDVYLALRAISSAPLLGTASANLPDLALQEGGYTLGLDVNPFLSVAVMGGVPLLLLVLAAAWRCGSRCRLIMTRAGWDNESIAAAMSVVYMFCLAALNTSQVFTVPKDMLALLLFVGIIEASNTPRPGASAQLCINSREIRTRTAMSLNGRTVLGTL